MKTNLQKLNRLKKTCLTLALIASTASLAQAQWLQHTTDVTGISTNSLFPGIASGGYFGNVKTSVSNLVDPLANGVPGVAPRSAPIGNLTSDFTNNYSVNSNNRFEWAGFDQNDTGDAFSVFMDFSGLLGGALPANSIIAFLDIDRSENLSNLKAKDISGNFLTSSWLLPITGAPTAAPGVFDYSNIFLLHLTAPQT